MWLGANEVLSELELPAGLAAGHSGFLLHPALLDGALQTAAALSAREQGMLVRLDWVRWCGPVRCRAVATRHITKGEGGKAGEGLELEISLVDQTGRMLARLSASTLRPTQRKRRTGPAEPKASVAAGARVEQVRKLLARLAAEVLKVDAAEIDLTEDLTEYGFDSIALTQFTNRLNEAMGLELTPADLFEYSSPEELRSTWRRNTVSGWRRGWVGWTNRRPTVMRRRSWMSHRRRRWVPAPVLDCVAGRDGVRADRGGGPERGVPRQPRRRPVLGAPGRRPRSDQRDPARSLRLGAAHHGDPPRSPNTMGTKWGGFMADVDKFDAPFFHISPREAELMDPQQRLFLEVVWRAIEDAAYRPSELAERRVGLFVGVSTSDYSELLARGRQPIDAYVSTGNAHSVLPNRISYLLNLRGPSEPVDTACSSALVALHRAVKSIHDGDCDMAIAGGVNVLLSPSAFIAFSQAGMLARDGRCKTFDKRADGYVRGEGCGRWS